MYGMKTGSIKFCLFIFMVFSNLCYGQLRDEPWGADEANDYFLPDHSATYASADNVQLVLMGMKEKHPSLIGFIEATGRYYLLYPRRDALPDEMVEEIQDAFFADISELCKQYGQLYLADWMALASKAARESFWGTSYLCNSTFNYFGIRHKAKPWICDSLFFCGSLIKNDPEPAAFAVFPNFETSLWVFIHTIYSRHFLERLPDGGARIADVISFERMNGIRYWQKTPYGVSFRGLLMGAPYSANELIYTWSEHEINNLCINCSRETDRKWVHKLILADVRSKE
jgi:hypothetical protein